MDSDEPPTKNRKLDLSPALKFDRLPPDVICSEILVHIVVNILYLPRTEYCPSVQHSVGCRWAEWGWQRTEGAECTERVTPESTIWWLSSLLDDFVLRETFMFACLLYCEGFGEPPIASLLEGTQSLLDTSLFGRFSRDPLRYPWFLFRSIRINHDEAGLWLYARTNAPATRERQVSVSLQSFDWMSRFVFLNLKQVVFLQLPKFEDWKSIQSRSLLPNLMALHCWGGKWDGDGVPEMFAEKLVLSYPGASVFRNFRNEKATLSQFAGTELICIEKDDWVDVSFNVLDSASVVENLKKLTMIGPDFGVESLPLLSSLEYLHLQNVTCSVDTFSSLDCSLRTLILRKCSALTSFPARCTRDLVRFWYEKCSHEDKVLSDDFLRDETLANLRDLKVVGVAFNFLWLPRSRRLRSLVINHDRDSDDESNLLIRGVDLQEVQYLHLKGVDIELVENGSPIDENKFVLLENSEIL